MLSWQFLSCGKRGLNNQQLQTLAIKLFGNEQNYENCKIPWTRFSKENLPDTNFTLWVWLDGILNLVKVYLSDLWSDGSIMGFINKGKERVLLKKKQHGTFLLRFSESIKDGGITFSWVQYSNNGDPSVQAVKPFTSNDLKQIALPDILCNFRIMVAENVPVNPLCHLYPNIPKDQAFGKYYSEKTGEENPYLKYLKTKLVFVSKKNGCADVREGPVSGLSTLDRDPPSSVSDVDDEDNVLLHSPENSPMFSSSTIDASLLHSILDNDGESLVPSEFAPQISPPQENDMDLLKEPLYPDIDVNRTLQDLIESSNILNGQTLSVLSDDLGDIILRNGFHDIAYNMPLTP